MIKITKYYAFDGSEFCRQEDCKDYEANNFAIIGKIPMYFDRDGVPTTKAEWGFFCQIPTKEALDNFLERGNERISRKEPGYYIYDEDCNEYITIEQYKNKNLERQREYQDNIATFLTIQTHKTE